jgi:hypothetical protein
MEEDDERVVRVDRGRALKAALDCVFVSTSELLRFSLSRRTTSSLSNLFASHSTTLTMVCSSSHRTN